MATGDIKTVYGTASDVTITLASLAPSSTYLGGRESASIDPGTDEVLDYLISGHIKTNATITAGGRIEVWVVGSYNGTDWPDVFDGTDSDETITNSNVKQSICKNIATIQVDATGTYPFGPVSVASRFGWSLPKKFIVFVTHGTHATNALDSTAGNHKIVIQPIYRKVVV